MTSSLVLSLIIILVGIEIVCLLIMRWHGLHQRRIIQRHIGGQPIDSLDEPRRTQVLKAAHAEYSRTIHRKIDLLIIAFHLPALASWGSITRQSRTPPLYYFLVTMGFWFALLFGAMKCVRMLLGQ